MEISLFGTFVLVLAVGAVAQWVGWRLKIPAILLLLGAGLAAGPVTGLIQPDEVFGDVLFPLVSVSVAIILFEGGLSLKLRDLAKGGTSILRLVTIGGAVTWALAGWLSWALLDFSPILSILFGALLTVTGPTVIGPMLRAIRPKGKVKAIAKWEGILNDPLGVLLAVLVFEVYLSQHYDDAPAVILLGLGETLLTSVVLAGAAAGFLLLLVRAKLMPEFLHNLFVLALVLGIFGASNAILEESGLLTVTLFGIILANQSVFNVRHIIDFKENLQVLLISSLFVVLAARVDFSVFAGLGWKSALFIAALIVVVRPLAVVLATIGSKQTSWRDRVLLMLLAPRGMVAMVLTSVFALRIEQQGDPAVGANMLAVMLLVIVLTVLVYGLLAGPVSSRLGLSNLDPQGVLFIGAHEWARAIASELKSLQVTVRMIDSNRYQVGKAVHEGINADCGNVFSEAFLENLDLSGIGHAVALTANDEVNSFAETTLAHYIEKGDIYPLKAEREIDASASSKVVNPPFGQDVTFSYLKREFERGAKLNHVTLRENFEFPEFEESYGKNALLLFCIDEDGRVRIFSAKTRIKPRLGSTLVFLETVTEQREKTPVA
ncbi:cation:proton antiporter [Ruficoccus amylovorans]|uniref:Cation:proton antiporter n=1 Tax=Ruficoccus amylovorans TaxID=1804625 RepID=A0A842HD42_9BACT|nr:sodium:proton antiporter [Ruficoccus amylovorans]MBC2594342.1 cation:proton antiporter [Ruficoccus amylovorans]